MKNSTLPSVNLLLSQPVTGLRWERLFGDLFRGTLNPEEAKKMLLLVAKKGEEATEIGGCLRAVRRMEPPRPVSLPFLVDVCGTGGDGAKTFNISTVSSFVIAAAGAYVAKHGNRAVSSQAGSSDLMEALGVSLDVPFPAMLEALRKCHLGYFHAPLYHPSFSRIQPLRRELNVRTLFNLMGPLVNPIEIRFQMVGVSDPRWLKPVAEALLPLKRQRAAVFHSADGLDELSTREPSDILYLEGGKLRPFRFYPRRLGFSKARKGDYEGGGLETNVEIARGILEDRIRGPRQDIVLLNSGFALWLVGLASSIQEGVEKSRWVLRNARALAVLEALRRFTKSGKAKR